MELKFGDRWPFCSVMTFILGYKFAPQPSQAADVEFAKVFTN